MKNVMSTLTCSVDANLNITEAKNYENEPINERSTCWNYWQDWYYPQIIRESYPVYIQEKSLDKGKKAYEIIKILKDKKLINIRTVNQFIDIMDSLIKIL